MNFSLTPNVYWLAAPLLAILAFVPFQHSHPGDAPKVRQAAVAGSFYPADPKVLSAMIDSLLAQVSGPPVTDPILAAVAPHAGYQYSGPVAAYTYAALKGRMYSRVVIIAPSHYVSFEFTSVYEGDAYATPLGNVPVDKVFARQLAKMSSTMQLSSRGHDATPEGAEHAIGEARSSSTGGFRLPGGCATPQIRVDGCDGLSGGVKRAVGFALGILLLALGNAAVDGSPLRGCVFRFRLGDVGKDGNHPAGDSKFELVAVLQACLTADGGRDNDGSLVFDGDGHNVGDGGDQVRFSV